MKKFLVIIAVLLLLLAFTNPNQSDYNQWVNNNLADKLNVNTDNTVGKALSSLSDKVIGSITQRHNYYLFSVYETNIGKLEVSKTLGICKFFIKLDQ